MKEKKVLLTFMVTIGIMSFLFFMTLFIYDPLSLFHKYSKDETIYIKDMRKQAPGFIDSFEHDSAIVGTSTSVSMSSLEASRQLGGKFINVSLNGSDFYERSYVLKYLFKKDMKKIVYTIDLPYFIKPRKGHPTSKIDDFDFLYDNNPLNDFKSYLNIKYLKCAFSFSKTKACIGSKAEWDRPASWHKIKSLTNRQGGLDKWFKSYPNNHMKRAFKIILSAVEKIKNNEVDVASDIEVAKRIGESKAYINKYVLDFAQKHPETRFNLVFPPFSRIKYALDAQYHKVDFSIYKELIKYLVSKSESYNNIDVYGWDNYSFLDNIAHYRDIDHYGAHVNSWILEALRKKEGHLTEDNIELYLNIFTQKSNSYNLIGLGKVINEFLDKFEKFKNRN